MVSKKNGHLSEYDKQATAYYDSIHVKTYGKHTGINGQLIIAVVDLT
jgi:hypothetical protein